MEEDSMDFNDDIAQEDDSEYEAQIGVQRHDVRRKIEEMLERKRLREEFGDLDDF